jgi:hypothetical protein
MDMDPIKSPCGTHLLKLRATEAQRYDTGMTDLLHRGPVSITWHRLIGKAIRRGFATAGLPGV